MVSYMHSPPIQIGARDSLNKMLAAEKVGMALLCTARALPAWRICIILTSNLPVAEHEPNLPDWVLLTTDTGAGRKVF